MDSDLSVAYQDGYKMAVKKCMAMLRDNLETEQYFGVFGQVNLTQFEEDLK